MKNWCLITLTLATGLAQQFEVASVKPSPLNTQRAPVKVDPSRLVYNSLSPKMLIQAAYKAAEWEIMGGPGGLDSGWLDSGRYDLAATLPPGSTQDQIPAMLQALLAERFQLMVHRESRQLPVYWLTIAKNGPKLRPGDTGEQWNEGVMKGGIFKGGLELHQLTMSGLAEVLAGKTGRPVIDMTHLSGIFDISLKWNPDDTAVGDSTSNAPSIYTAVEEQLGLKLVPTKAPVEILVIDRMERPSAN